MKPSKPKQKKIKKEGYLMIRNKISPHPWSMTLFFTEREARAYFKKKVKENGWNFTWASFRTFPVILFYNL